MDVLYDDIRSDLTTLRGRATLFRDTSLAALLPTSFLSNTIKHTTMFAQMGSLANIVQ